MIIFLYGADSFRSKRLVTDMKNKFIKEIDAESNSLSFIDGQNTDLKEIAEKLNTGSLFTKKRMIIIANIFKNKKTKIFAELLNYLTTTAEEDGLIIIFKDDDLGSKKTPLKADAKKLFSFLSKQKFVQEFKPLTSAGLLKFIKEEVSLYNKSIEEKTALDLIKKTNGDLWLIAQGIKKAALITDNQIITQQEMQEVSSEVFNENIFALTDAIGIKNKKLALKLLEEQYAAGLSDEYLIAILTRQFKLLIAANAALTAGLKPNEIASKLSLHPFVAQKAVTQAKNFNQSQLKTYFNKVIALDSLNKTSSNDIKSELVLLLANM